MSDQEREELAQQVADAVEVYLLGLQAISRGEAAGAAVPLTMILALGGALLAIGALWTEGGASAGQIGILLLLPLSSFEAATALPAAVTGAHDLGTTTGAATRVALVHAATMDVTLGLFGAAWVARRRGSRRTARRLALAGTALVGAGAYLGGHLVYRLGVGVED